MYAIVDTETGGLMRKTDAVLQLAAAIVDDDLNLIDKFMSYIYPPSHLLIRVQALASNRVDMMKVLTAPPEIEVAQSFNSFLKRWQAAAKKRPVFVAYNAQFDYWMLDSVQARTGETFAYNQPKWTDDGIEAPPWIDVLVLARRLVSSKQVKNHQLKTMAAHFGIPHADAHDALADVLVTRQVWKELRKL